MVIQRSSLVQGHTTVESKRSGFVAKTLLAAGFAVVTLNLFPQLTSTAHASHTAKHQDQAASRASNDAAASGPKANPDKKADAKAAREKKKAEKAAAREEKLAKAKAAKKGDHGEKVAKADSKQMNDDMGGSDDPLEGL